MKILSIDTSTKVLSIAITEDEKVLTYKNVRIDKMLSSVIISHIDKVLAKANLNLNQMDGFALGLGPGSFTSLRVGVSTVKGLAYATGKPVVAFSSLDILALGIKAWDQQICTLCDARRNLVYASFYKNDDGLKQCSEYMLTDIKTVKSLIKEETVFVGDGLTLYKDDLSRLKKKAVFIEDEKLWHPQAKLMHTLALPKFQQKQTENIDTLVPLYLYSEDCQVRK